MDDFSFKKILEYFNLSWSGYRKVRKGVKKRIARHMQTLNLSGIDDYLKLVEKDKDIGKVCLLHLSVSISQFYRDRTLWCGLEKEILPLLLQRFSSQPKFRVWSCGCARGEEAYSFLMLWENFKSVQNQLPDLEIIATDLNPEYIKMAMESIYEFRSLKELPKSLIEKYFSKIPDGNKYRFDFCLKNTVTLKRHNFMEENPPSGEFHVIFMRNNLLTYYNDPHRTEVLLKITNTLKRGGALIIGSHEKIPGDFSGLSRCRQLPCLYFKSKG